MNDKYIFVPKNPNLKHCSDLFLNALKVEDETGNFIQSLKSVQFKTIWALFQKILNSKNDSSVFFLAVQSDYLGLLFFLKLVTYILPKEIRVYYLMHEPWLERGRTNLIKSFIIFMHQFLFGRLADVILLPSDEAVAKAKAFVQQDKIRKINLAFLSVPQTTLEKNLQLLKCSWETRKTFSMVGTISSSDKNPQGFLDFVGVFNELYPEQAQFIRGGCDRSVQVQYDEDLVIRFPSYLSNSAKKFLFSLSHFVIIPYSFSTQSGVVAEALSHGKLLVLNDITSFSYLKSHSFAFFVNFNSKDELIRCINNLVVMDVKDYEESYWKAINYFNKNHSEEYLRKALKNIFIQQI